VYSGQVGTGFDHALLATIYKELHKRERTTTPFQENLDRRAPKGTVWVKPELVGEVQFAGWTSDGILRHPSFEGLREDKKAQEVVIERTPSERARVENKSTAAVAAKRRSPPTKSGQDVIAGVTLTHPDRVLYPEQGVTKRDLCHYYEDIAKWMIPYIKGRPLSLVRCPSGEGQACFYQKHLSDMTPDAVRGIRIKEKSKTDTYILVDDAKGLVSLAQIGVLEFHPWGSTEKYLEKPDLLVFDLDPAPDLDWNEVLAGARLLRKILDEVGLTSFVKTTGGKGLHVVVPVEPTLSWDAFKDFAGSIAAHLEAEHPDKYVANMSKAKRTDKIFIDYFRNGRGAAPGAPGTTPARQSAPRCPPPAGAPRTPKKNTPTF
jgi:bifunctional non-homologous end joining protein LigD